MRRVLLNVVLPSLVIETVARLVGWVAGLLTPLSGYSTEALLRGRLIALRDGLELKYLGRAVVMDDVCRIKAGAGTKIHTGTIITVGSNGYCHIGANSHVSHYSVLAASGGISIGNRCGISANVLIYSTTYMKTTALEQEPTSTPADLSPVSIGDGVHIGAGARILPGVTIGNGAVVGAGSVVTNDVPSWTVVSGVPAKPLKRNTVKDPLK